MAPYDYCFSLALPFEFKRKEKDSNPQKLKVASMASYD